MGNLEWFLERKSCATGILRGFSRLVDIEGRSVCVPALLLHMNVLEQGLPFRLRGHNNFENPSFGEGRSTP